MLAIDDALRLFAADEIIVAAHPNRQANWLERGIVRRARARYPQPIRHVVAAA
jgi:hypothetical protein